MSQSQSVSTPGILRLRARTRSKLIHLYGCIDGWTKNAFLRRRTMKKRYRKWSFIAVIGLMVLAILGCALPTATVTPTPMAQSAFAATLLASSGNTTPTPGQAAGGGTSGNSGGTGGSSGGNGGGNGGTGGSTGGTDNSSTATPTQPPVPYAGPYVVKQIQTLGGEAISGFVCSVTQPFSVLSNTPHVTFTFIFVPQDAQQGKVSYTYSIPKAGESHDAAGTYALSPVSNDGTLQLSLSVSDHVVFKGFDGNIPNKYKFNLVPSGSTPCPSAP